MDNNLYQKAYAFALRIIKMHRFLRDDKHEYILSKQVLRCGTAIGANIAEANGAISKNDFSSKISISYKECLETKYWLSLLKDSCIISDDHFSSMHKDADELAKILYTILQKSRPRTY